MTFALLLPRRHFLLGACSAGVLSACGQRRSPDGSAPDAAAKSRAEPKPGGELLFAFDGTAASQFALDPHNSAFAPHHRIMRSIFDSLVVARPDKSFGPWLATRWELNPEGTSYTFTLREDVRFHDGAPFDAAAVKVNFDRLLDPKNALLWQSDLGPLRSVSVVSQYVVRFDFERPFVPFIANLSKSCLGIISPKAIAQYGAELPVHPVGTGPFKLERITPGTEVALVRSDDYRWAPAGERPGPAYLDRLVFRNVPEEATRVAVLESGQAGAADLIPPQNLVGLKKASAFQVHEGELLNHNYAFYINVQRRPWDDARAREAFKLALDLDSAVKTIYRGTAARAWSVLSPSLLGYDPGLERSYQPARERANAAFDALGWQRGPDGVRVKDGKRLTVVFLDAQGNREKRLDLVAIVRRQLAEVGVELRIESQPGGNFLAKISAGDYDVVGGSQFAADPDVLRRLYTPGGRAGASLAKVDDPELTGLLERGAEELAPEKRLALYRNAQQLIAERTYAIPIYVLLYNVASAATVRGLRIDTHGFPSFADTWIAV
jgi:peptide/nickel transport system substrate-binding protein